jgi:two-component system NtrC family sensor kinase
MKSTGLTVKQTKEEEVLKILSEQAPVGVCIMQDSKFCYVNHYFSIATGYTLDELVGNDSSVLVDPEDREVVRENTIKMLRGEIHTPYQFRVICRNGDIIWVMATVKSIHYQGRQAILGNYMEITERERVERRIQESERHYRLLAENVEDVIWTVDMTCPTRLTYISPSVTRLLGYSVDEIVAKEMEDIFTSDSFNRAMQVFEEEIAREKEEHSARHRSRRLDLQLRHKNDYLVDVEVNYSVIRGADGQSDEILAVARDITEYKRAERALIESEERYRELASSITAVFFAMDSHLRYTYWNRASEALTGIPAEDAIGRSIREVFTDKPWRRRAEKLYRKVLRTKQPQTFMSDYDIDGRHYVFEINAYPSRDGLSVFVSDITERMQADKARKEAEEEVIAFLEEAPVGIIHTDLKGNITYVNKRFESESGYLREEIVGKSGFQMDWLSTGTTKYLVERMAARLKGRPAKHWETQFKCKDGRWIWIDIEGKVLRKLGVPVGFQIISRNITERKQAEEALRQSEERYRTILEEMEEGYYEVDISGNFAFVTDAMCHILGYSQNELIGMNYKTYTPKEDVQAIFEAYNHVYRTGEPLKSFPMVEVRKDGNQVFVEDSVFPIRDDKGEVIGFRGISRDVTEHKRAEEALELQRAYFQQLFDNSPDAIVMLNTKKKIVQANKGFEKLFGYSSEQIKGRTIRELIVPEDCLKEAAAVSQMVFRGEVVRRELVRKRKDGKLLNISMVAYPVRFDGKLVGIYTIYSDITERKQMEEALCESEKKLRLISENSRDIICLHNPDHRYAYISPACREILGYEPEELIGTNPWELVHPEDLEAIQGEGQERALQGMPVLLTYRIRKKSGEYIWFESVSQLLKDNTDNLLGFVTSSRDINERRQAEEALRQSEERYRTILEEMEDAYFEVDLGGHITFANNSTCRDLGYSRKELMGMSYKDFTIEDDIDPIFRVFNEVYQTGVPNKGFPWKTIHKDGSHGIAETSVSLLRNDRGEIIGFRGVGRDITERKRVEEALRQSEENYRALFDSLVIGTFVLDADTMRIVIGNQAAVEMFGFNSVEEVIGTNPLDFIPPEDKEGVLEIITKELLEQDLRKNHELRAMTKDGRKIWISITGARIVHNGQLAGLISFTDITEQKQQRERLMMTDRLASLGELASGAAHELNNPLTSIIGFSQLLMEKEVPEDIHEDLKLISNEAQRAASVTNNLLTFARKHAPMKQLNQINNIIEDVLELRAHEHEVNRIDIERNFDIGLPEVMVDYFQMQQVFMNITINAEYFMTDAHNKGTLTITTKQENRHVKISITDDGPGIPAENLQHIFDPFFTTKEAGKGTGLGLSICHGIVTEHGGQIYVRSQLGKGTTVFIELPIKRRARIKSVL